MCLSAMASPVRGHGGALEVLSDVRAVIEPRAYTNVQTPAGGVVTRERREPRRLVGRGREREAGRPPRTLADRLGARLRERLEAGAYRRTGETAAALHGRKMIAENVLHRRDGGAETAEIAFDQGRQGLHQHQATELRGRGVAERRHG